MIGLPGLLGFNALFYSIKSFSDHPIFGTTLILIMCAFLSAAMIKNYRAKDGFSEKVGIKFILLLVLNFICASSIHFVGIKYGLD